MKPEEEFRLKRIGGYALDGKNLGKGAFSRVELATHILSNSKVAIKVINLEKISESYLRKNILRESTILKTLRHENIVRLYETMSHQNNYYFVTEYLAGGNLLNHLHKQRGEKKLSEKAARKIFTQLLCAVQYLHSKGIIHRDLKLQNIMLTEAGKIVKLIDFGLSNFLNKDNLLTTRCGSAEFAAPELFEKGRNYGPAVEIWSLGVILFAMTLGRMPFQASTCEKKESFIVQVRRGLNISHEHLLVNVSKELKNLLNVMLEPDDEKRITLNGVMTNTWVTENGKYPLLPSAPDIIPHYLRAKVVERVADMYSQSIDVAMESINTKKNDAMSATFQILMDKELKYCKQKSQQRAVSAPVSKTKKSRESYTPTKTRKNITCSPSCATNSNDNEESFNTELGAENLEFEKLENDNDKFKECLKITKTRNYSSKKKTKLYPPISFMNEPFMKNAQISSNDIDKEKMCVPPHNSCAATKSDELKFYEILNGEGESKDKSINDEAMQNEKETIDTSDNGEKTTIEGMFEIEADDDASSHEFNMVSSNIKVTISGDRLKSGSFRITAEKSEPNIVNSHEENYKSSANCNSTDTIEREYSANRRCISPFQARQMLHRYTYPLTKTFLEPDNKPKTVSKKHYWKAPVKTTTGYHKKQRKILTNTASKDKAQTDSKMRPKIISSPESFRTSLNSSNSETLSRHNNNSRCSMEMADEILSYENQIFQTKIQQGSDRKGKRVTFMK